MVSSIVSSRSREKVLGGLRIGRIFFTEIGGNLGLLTISKPSHSGMIGDERKMQEAKMAEHGLEEKPMPTIWRVPDQLWEKIEPILTEHDPPKSTGRPRIDQREALDRASSSE